MFFGGYGMSRDNLIKTISGLSRLWDGSDIRRKRSARSETVLIHGVRLSLNLMVQPSVFSAAANVELLRTQGLKARMLPAYPKPLHGKRKYKPTNIKELHCLKCFQSRLSQLLGNGHREPLEPIALNLCGEAKQWWIDYYNQTEAAQAIGGKYAQIPEATSKTAELAARIACVLEAYATNNTKEISLESMVDGIYLAQHYLDMQLFLFRLTDDNRDANAAIEIWEWAEKYLSKEDKALITKRDIQNRGPNKFRRQSGSIHSAMAVLVELGYFKATKFRSDEPIQWDS